MVNKNILNNNCIYIMNDSSSIKNDVKFALYANYYISKGFELTYLNGYFGNRNVLRIFTIYDFFDYYDNEIESSHLGIRKDKGFSYWIIFMCAENCSPIFRNDIKKLGIESVNYGDKVVNPNYKMGNNLFSTALECSSYFNYKNSYQYYSFKDGYQNDATKIFNWWEDLYICECKDIEKSVVYYQIMHKDELEMMKLPDLNYALPQYDFVQLFKTPVTYIRKRNNPTPFYDKIVFKSLFWAQATGVGVKSGCNGYRCIDIDGCSSLDLLKNMLSQLGIPVNYEWIVSTGSNNGFHIWIRLDNFPSNLLMNSHTETLFKKAGFIVFEPNDKYKFIFKRIELRWKSHIIMPPSLSGYGFNYNFVNGLPKNTPISVSEDILINTLNHFGYNTALNYQNIVYSKDRRIGPSLLCYNFHQTLIMVLDIKITELVENQDEKFSFKDNWPYLVKISYQIISGFDNEVLKECDFILKPEGFTISQSSSMIHGITNEIASEKGWDRRDLYRYLIKQIEAIDYFVCHNLSLNINILKCELLRYSELNESQIESLFGRKRYICTMKSSVDFCAIKKYADQREYNAPSLKELHHKLFGCDFCNTNNSLDDVRAVSKCFFSLNNRRVVSFCKNHLIRLNFVCENHYCLNCGGELKEDYQPDVENNEMVLKCIQCGILYKKGYRTGDYGYQF